jgi:putative phosphoribosyl transferase
MKIFLKPPTKKFTVYWEKRMNEWGEPTVIPAGEVILAGNLQVPENSRGLVLFVHGSGSSRLSPRNNYVARSLNQLGLATLLFDLLTAEEDKIDEFTREYRFDIPLLARRLNQVTAWVGQQHGLKNLALGYFGASTGAAAALIAAAENKDVKAVVSRGGRPDLAAKALSKVKAATLLIVGEQDPVVIDLNRQAQAELSCVNQLVIVPGATHLFEEPGALDQVNTLAGEWFRSNLC